MTVFDSTVASVNYWYQTLPGLLTNRVAIKPTLWFNVSYSDLTVKSLLILRKIKSWYVSPAMELRQ